MPYASIEIRGARVEIHHRPACGEQASVFLRKHCATPGCKDDAVERGEFRDNLRFTTAESGLTFNIEYH